MKKYFILMSAALVALSCAKELADPQEATGNENITYKTITFESIATKTTLDGVTGDVAWEEGDQISIYYVNEEGKPAETVATAASAAATTTFSAQIPETENPEAYYAAYPKGAGRLTVTEATAETPASVSFAVYVAPTQCDGTFKDANYAAAYTLAGESMTLAFKNAVGIVKVPLPKGGVISNNGKDYKISGVYVRGINGADANNGNVPVETAEGAVSGFGAAGGTKNINLSSLSEAAIATGYAYLPTAKCNWTNGICVRFLSDDGAIPAVLSQNKSIVIERGHVLSLPDVSGMVVFDYYVSKDGEGDGTSSDTPMNFSKMQEMFTAAGGTMADCYKLDGVTFNLDEDEYLFAEPFAIATSANNTPYSVTIKGNDSDPSKVILNGNNESGIFTVSNTYASILFKNIKATGANVNGQGGVVKLTGGNLKFDTCIFESNTATTGGVMFVQNTSVEFDNCTFKSNKGANGSVFGINTATVKCNRCVFTENTGTAKLGAIFYGETSPIAYLNSCYFQGNTKPYAAGICVYFNNTTGKIGMNNVTIVGGTAEITQNIQVQCKGYSVISNSTLWATKCTWGVFGMGYNGDVSGAVLVNNILCNKTASQPGIGTTSGYTLRSAYNIISTVLPLSGTELSKYDSESCVTGMFNGGKPFEFETPSNYSHNLYVWDGTLGKCTDELTGELTKPTLAQVEAEILKAEGIGEDFLAWLKSIKNANGKNALEVDSRGVERNTDAMWPGAYQNDPVETEAN